MVKEEEEKKGKKSDNVLVYSFTSLFRKPQMAYTPQIYIYPSYNVLLRTAVAKSVNIRLTLHAGKIMDSRALALAASSNANLGAMYEVDNKQARSKCFLSIH